mmetsp:Transcript_30509/g.22626  ORF Transcript_30509/g.22626 Transcript_30509/m.22626 type:complete len:140 (+) Transcript_30509:11-430(+)
MDSINSLESRKQSPIQSMQRLEKEIFTSDIRFRIRGEIFLRAKVILALAICCPLSAYMCYQWFHPNGMMNQPNTAAGIYGYSVVSFLNTPRMITQIWRPELYYKEQYRSLSNYERKVEKMRREAPEKLTEGVHYPTAWH